MSGYVAGRPCEVAAETLESLPVAGLDGDLGVDVEAHDLGEGLGR